MGCVSPAMQTLQAIIFRREASGGTWVVQLVERLTSAQVLILRFMGSSPIWGSVLTAQSLKAASDSVSPSLSAPALFVLSLAQK